MNLCINDFSGPLDLLLHLVKTAKMDIYEIDTKYIIDKYLEFINTIDKEDLDSASEYLVMASELIHLKSRLLLNLEVEDESDSEYAINSEEDLKNRLIEYERLSEFMEKETIEKGIYDADILSNALAELQKRMNYQKPINTKITRKEISVVERKKYIRDFISKRKKVNFFDLFEDYSKDMIVATFLSILDMCKEQEIKLTQKENFSDILIERV